MNPASSFPQHQREHADARRHARLFQPASSDLIRVGSRRWFLQTGLAGLAGVSLPDVLRQRSQAAGSSPRKTAVILFWLSGGPSHIDMWDPKPDAPSEVRGPFGVVQTKVPGIQPQAALAASGPTDLHACQRPGIPRPPRHDAGSHARRIWPRSRDDPHGGTGPLDQLHVDARGWWRTPIGAGNW
jgi:hypothetical protein